MMKIFNITENLATTKKNPLSGGDKRVQTRFLNRPDIIKYMFIGESVPHNGTFFYHKNSILFEYTLKAFKDVFPGITQVNFLTKFKEMGFYLDDLCSEPVDQLKDGDDKKKRVALRVLYEEDLSKRIALFNPEIIFVTPKEIVKNIKNVIKSINMEIELIELPFPVRSETNIKNYIEKLSTSLKILKDKYNLNIV